MSYVCVSNDILLSSIKVQPLYLMLNAVQMAVETHSALLTILVIKRQDAAQPIHSHNLKKEI